eukprot:m.99953 g.99953  ORF g.99953 m.99953 type:complete len:189 (-) comp13687_c0_seq8:396-962(-)
MNNTAESDSLLEEYKKAIEQREIEKRKQLEADEAYARRLYEDLNAGAGPVAENVPPEAKEADNDIIFVKESQSADVGKEQLRTVKAASKSVMKADEEFARQLTREINGSGTRKEKTATKKSNPTPSRKRKISSPVQEMRNGKKLLQKEINTLLQSDSRSEEKYGTCPLCDQEFPQSRLSAHATSCGLE